MSPPRPEHGFPSQERRSPYLLSMLFWILLMIYEKLLDGCFIAAICEMMVIWVGGICSVPST